MDSGNVLSLGKLEPLPGTLLSVLLAFLDTRIASYETGMFQRRTKVGIVFEQCSRDAVPDRSRLTRWTTTAHVNDEVKLTGGFGQLQGLTNDHPQGFIWKIAVERF